MRSALHPPESWWASWCSKQLTTIADTLRSIASAIVLARVAGGWRAEERASCETCVCELVVLCIRDAQFEIALGELQSIARWASELGDLGRGSLHPEVHHALGSKPGDSAQRLSARWARLPGRVSSSAGAKVLGVLGRQLQDPDRRPGGGVEVRGVALPGRPLWCRLWWWARAGPDRLGISACQGMLVSHVLGVHPALSFHGLDAAR